MRAHRNTLPCAFKLLTCIHNQDKEKNASNQGSPIQPTSTWYVYIHISPTHKSLESQEPCTWPSSRRGSGFQWGKTREGEKHVWVLEPKRPSEIPGGHGAALAPPLPLRRGASPRCAKSRGNYFRGDGTVSNQPAQGQSHTGAHDHIIGVSRPRPQTFTHGSHKPSP